MGPWEIFITILGWIAVVILIAIILLVAIAMIISAVTSIRKPRKPKDRSHKIM